MATHEFDAGPLGKMQVLQAGTEGQPVTIQDAHFLFTAEFDRNGNDLFLTDESGQTVMVEGYFAVTTPPDLASPEGALLRASVVESLAGPLAPGQYAQAGAPSGATPIGTVESLEGSATAQRADGTTVTLKIGDPVFQGDVVATSASSKVGITFVDQTVFTLSEDARMVLDELVYSPGGSDNSMLVNLVQGTFVFVAGQVAPTGDMKVQTPVATMGIRGTTVMATLSTTDGTLTVSLQTDPGGGSGSYQIIDTATGLVLATVEETLKTWVISPTEPGQPPTVVVKPEEALADETELLTFLYETYQTASAKFSNSQSDEGNDGDESGPNSVPGSGIESGQEPGGTNPLNQNAPPSNNGEGGSSVPPPAPPADPSQSNGDQSQLDEEDPPSSEGIVIVTDEDTALDGIEIPVTGSSPETAIITITELPAKGLLLFNDEPVSAGDTIGTGELGDLTFSPNGEFEELTAADEESLQFVYTVSNPSGQTSEPVIAEIRVPGVNDTPTAVGESAGGTENQSFLIDVLGNDSDVDRNDDPSNFILSEAEIVTDTGGEVSIVDNQLQFTPGTSFDSLNVEDSAEVVVEYTMTDDEGAPSSAQVVITLAGENDAPTVDLPVISATAEDTGLLVPGITIADVDNETLTVTITAGSTVTLSDTAGLTSVDGNGTEEVVIEGSVEAINEALNAGGGLLYTPSNDFSGDGTLTFALDDGGGAPVIVTQTISITPVNDAPELAGDGAAEVSEGGTVAITLSDLTGIDPDDAGTELTYTVTSEPNHGRLELSSAPGVAIAVFTQADLENGLVQFVHDGSETLSDSFDVSLADGGEDGAAPATGTVEIAVTPVNDGPLLGGTGELAVGEGSSVVIELSDLTAIDPDDSGDGLVYTVTEGPSNGRLEFVSLEFSEGFDLGSDGLYDIFEGETDGSITSFTQADLDAGRVQFVHDGSDTGSDAFTVSLADGGEDGAAPATGTIQITVAPKNDAPALAGDLFAQVSEDDGVILTASDIAAFDPDDSGTGLTYSITQGPSHGLLEFTTAPDIALTEFTQADLDNGLVRYVHDGSETESDEFTVSLADGGEDGATPDVGTFQIDVTPTNDAPKAQSQDVETTEGTPISGTLVATDPDIGDVLTFSIGPNGAENGTVTIEEDGSFVFEPGEGFLGFASFDFTVTDQANVSSTATVTVEVDQQEFTNSNGQSVSLGIDGEAPLSSEDPSRDGVGIGNAQLDVAEVTGSAINVSFVFDSSGSLNVSEYNLQLQAVQTAIDDIRTQFEGSQTDVDVQLVKFSSGVTAEEYDLFDPALNDIAALESFAYTPGLTNYEGALGVAEEFFNEQPDGEQNFLLFSSDGQPNVNDPNYPDWETVTAPNLQEIATISAFGIGQSIDEATLDLLDNTGGSQNVESAADLSNAFSGTPIFAAELVDFSLKLAVDGEDLGEIANEDDLQPDNANFDLLLADVPDIGEILGEENHFTATAVFDFDGDIATTDDQVTLISAESISASDTAVTKTGTSGNDLLLGGDLVDEISGEAGDDVILGFSGGDTLQGGDGNDALIGGGGGDTLLGGADDDTLVVSDASFQEVNGGTGQDTLVLDETDLDFTNLDPSSYGSIETIDLTDTGANALTLDLDSVQNLSETVNTDLDAILDGLLGSEDKPADSLVVAGAAGDTVNFASEDDGAWQLLNETAFADHDIYAFEDSSGNVLAAVAIDDDVAVTGAV